jgi:dTMP kinase
MNKNPYPGRFFVVEGLDGSGLSTQARLLRDFLLKKGYKVVLTKEPTFASPAGKKIRKILDKKEKASPWKLQQLFAEDRAYHLKNKIIPNLKKGKIVISDRYFFSSLAFGKAQGLPLNKLIKLNRNFLLPDLTFILRVRPKVCLERIHKRGNEKTLFEDEKRLGGAYRNFAALPKRFKNVKLINGSKSVKDVFSEIRKILSKAEIL